MAENRLVSFIIPAYNAERSIGKCIESVLRQKVRKQVLVVDDGSTDSTGEKVREFGRRVTMIGKENRGPASARNAGLSAAKGGFIAFVDSDVELTDKWAVAALKLLGSEKVCAVGGPGISKERGIVAEALNNLLYGQTTERQKLVDSLATMDVMYRASAIRGMRFDTRFRSASGEDPDFNFRLVRRGEKLLFSPRLWVWHNHPTTLGGIMRKWYNYGKHYRLLFSKHRDMKGRGYYARMLYFPVLIAASAASVAWWPIIAVPAAQIALLYIAYLRKGLALRLGAGSVAFAAVHTLKQLSQLLGILRGSL